jgi:hypothetical protein
VADGGCGVMVKKYVSVSEVEHIYDINLLEEDTEGWPIELSEEEIADYNEVLDRYHDWQDKLQQRILPHLIKEWADER